MGAKGIEVTHFAGQVGGFCPIETEKCVTPEGRKGKGMGSERELVILNTIAQALNRSVELDSALQATLAQVAQ